MIFERNFSIVPALYSYSLLSRLVVDKGHELPPMAAGGNMTRIATTVRFRNWLLRALPEPELACLKSVMKEVALSRNEILYTQDTIIEAVHFPESGVISLLVVLESGEYAEVGVVGREGLIGGSLILGNNISSNETMVLIPGTAYRADRTALESVLGQCPSIRRLLLRYLQCLYVQVSQTAACNGHHALERRLARWLLMANERTGSNELPITQEALSMMLGVHRPGVSVAASRLQSAGIIRYRRGQVEILDKSRLEAASCECYAAVRHHTEQLLRGPAIKTMFMPW